MKYKEILKLMDMLKKENISFTTFEDFGGHFIKVPIAIQEDKMNEISIIQHDHSYGGEMDLLEIMGGLTKSEMANDSVLGHLTAEEVIKRVKYCLNNGTLIYGGRKAK